MRNKSVKVDFKPLNVFYAHASYGFRTNPLLYSQEVWFTKSVALTVISSVIGEQVEQRDEKNTRGQFEVKTATHVVAKHVNQFGHEIDFEHAAVVDKDRDYHKRLFWNLEF